MVKFFGFLFILICLYLTHGIAIEMAKRKSQDGKNLPIDIKTIERIIFWPKLIW